MAPSSNRFVRKFSLTLALSTALTTPVFADDLADTIKAMLTTAYESGEQANLDAVLAVAIATWPDKEEAIRAYLSSLSAVEEITEVTVENEETILEEEEVEKKNILWYVDPTKWDGKVELGGSVSDGTTEEKAVSFGFELKREFSKEWEHILRFDLDYAERLNVTSKNRLNASYEIMWKPWEPIYVMSFTHYERDRFTGYDYRFTQNFGVGYQIFKNNSGHALRVEVGPGYRVSGLANSMDKTDEFLGRFSTTYELPLGDNLFFKEYAALLMNKSQRTFTNRAELSAKINSHLAAKLTHDLKYDRLAPVGTPKTSTTTRASLVYDF